MTNERFIYVLDNDEDTIYDLLEKNILSKKDIEDKMNELHEENQSLKFQLEECRNHKLFSRRELEKENEQLKKESYGNLDGLNYYQEQNGHLSNKISDLECENEQLKHQLQQQEMEYATTCNRLAEENEQLKTENKKLNERIGILEGSLIDKGFDIND